MHAFGFSSPREIDVLSELATSPVDHMYAESKPYLFSLVLVDIELEDPHLIILMVCAPHEVN